MKGDFKIVVLLVERPSFRGGLKAGFYCIRVLHCCQFFVCKYTLYEVNVYTYVPDLQFVF